MRSAAGNRRLLLAALASTATVFAASDGVLITVGHAQQDDSQAANFGIYNGQVRAAADREQVGSTTNAGFTEGLVDNFYPFARVGVAPAGTSAAASPGDTGPFAQAVFGGQNVVQPQYVYAQYPGTQNPPGYTAGSATATASVTPLSATAAGTYGAVGNSTTAPPTSKPDGSDGGTASDISYFDSTLGFVTIGDSRVQHASYGGGVLVIDNVHVAVQVTTKGDGKFTKSISVTVGGAAVVVSTPPPLPPQSVSIPVTIDQNGVTVQGNNFPLNQQAANDAVNAVLKNAGITVHTVAPTATQDGTNLHVDAEGVVIDVQQAVQPPGVPTQFVRHTLGVVVLDNEATPAAQLPTDTSAGTGDSSSPTTTVPDTTTTTTGGGTGSSGDSTGASSAAVPTAAPKPAAKPILAPVAAVLTQPQPRWLLLAYLAWQALMLALAGALYLRRTALRRTS
jgi:hypothetical protein